MSWEAQLQSSRMDSDSSDAWRQYFSASSADSASSTALEDELLDREADVFHDECNELYVVDIKDGEATTTAVSGLEVPQSIFTPPAQGLRVISLYSNRTIAPLRVTSSTAARLFQAYGIRHEFLRILLSFGDEPQGSEASSSNYAMHLDDDDSYSLAYKVNYVEQNRRSKNAPWSFRHVGVYHRHMAGTDVIVVVHCTKETSAFQRLSQLWEQPASSSLAVLLEESPMKIHDLVVSSYTDNWRPYLRYLADEFSQVNDRAMVVDPEKASEESFRRVQSLRNTTDFCLFANACCTSNLEIVDSLAQSQLFPRNVGQRFSIRAGMLRGFIESSKVLQGRIRNAVDLVGYTLTLHNQMETTRLNREVRDMTEQIKNLAQESGEVTKKLQELTQNTVDDSAVVSIITIVSAVYLPGSFVSTIFGMNFFDFDAAAGRIAVTSDFWIFIVVWLSLMMVTAATFLLIYWRKRGLASLRRRRPATIS